MNTTNKIADNYREIIQKLGLQIPTTQRPPFAHLMKGKSGWTRKKYNNRNFYEKH